MLVRVRLRDEAQALACWRGDAGRRYMLQLNLQRRDIEPPRPRLYADNIAAPRLLAHVHGPRLMLHGPRDAVRRLTAALLADPRGVLPGWPDAAARRAWKTSASGRPFVRLNNSYAGLRGELLRAGFESNQADWQQHQPHYLYWITGRPRFARLVRHPCRLGAGQELHSLLVTGIPYDETGEYTRMCLEHGPSFVCEVSSRGRTVQVAWSCTHLSQAIGMIFTPEKHRGRGYGTSVTAFQTDYLLARDGIAYAYVRWDNLASQAVFAKLAARRTREPLSGATFYWPAGREPR
jgi:hypothetical protein